MGRDSKMKLHKPEENLVPSEIFVKVEHSPENKIDFTYAIRNILKEIDAKKIGEQHV